MLKENLPILPPKQVEFLLNDALEILSDLQSIGVQPEDTGLHLYFLLFGLPPEEMEKSIQYDWWAD